PTGRPGRGSIGTGRPHRETGPSRGAHVTPLQLGLLLVWGRLVGVDLVSLPQIMISRPLVAGTVAGLLAGDPVSGVIVGATLELVAWRASCGIRFGRSSSRRRVCCSRASPAAGRRSRRGRARCSTPS